MKGKVQIMTGKQTCETLKKIRRDIAEYNNFDIQISDCPHGDDVKCPGTCPKCEAEARALERAIKARKKLGKKVVIAGISAGIIVGTVACEPLGSGKTGELEGDIAVTDTGTSEPLDILEGEIIETDPPTSGGRNSE